MGLEPTTTGLETMYSKPAVGPCFRCAMGMRHGNVGFGSEKDGKKWWAETWLAPHRPMTHIAIRPLPTKGEVT